MFESAEWMGTGGERAAVRRTDVAVFGGGPAGICAAVAAARGGARVLLVERYGYLGGMASAGMVNPIYGFGYFGPGRQIVAGLAEEVIRELGRVEGGTLGHRRRAECEGCPGPDQCRTSGVSSLVPVDGEGMKLAALRLVREAGVELLLYSTAESAVTDGGRLEAVVLWGKSGRQAIRSRVFIDATGDGDVAAAAGATCEVGRAGDGALQPQSLIFHIAGLRREEDRLLLKVDPPAGGVGRLLLFRMPRAGHYIVNCDTGLFGLNPLEPRDLTRAHTHAMTAAHAVVPWLREHVEGCGECHLVATAPQLGLRESRRVLGDYVLTKEDVLGARKFTDGVARGCFPLDIHDLTANAADGNPMAALACGEYYEIPYRCLLPRGVEGLLTAGRCISGTHEAHGSYRVMATCMGMGEAAGTAAALAVRRDCMPRQVNAAELRRALADRGALPAWEAGS